MPRMYVEHASITCVRFIPSDRLLSTQADTTMMLAVVCIKIDYMVIGADGRGT